MPAPSRYSLVFLAFCLLVRMLTALLVPLKDLLQFALWLLAFSGNQIEWRGERMRLRPDGTLVKAL